MKHNRLLNLLMGLFFSAVLAVSTTGCLVSGFDLPLESLTKLFLVCTVTALVAAAMLQLRFGAAALLVLSVILTVALWRRSTLQEQLQTLVLMISTHYHQIYDWPLLGAQAAAAVDIPLMLLGCWTAACTAFYYFGFCHILVILPLLLVPSGACMIVTHTVPDSVYLFLLIFCTAVLLLTDWVRNHDASHHVAFVLRIMVPVAVFLALIFGLNPRDTYVNRASEFQSRTVSWLQQLQKSSISSTNSVDTIGSRTLNLKTVGPKSTLSYAVMRVTSPISGRIYLRGQAYDVYTGTGWESSGSKAELFTRGRNTSGTLTITTYGTRDLMYVPYYPSSSLTLTGGRLENTDKLDRYSYSLSISAVYGSDKPEANMLILPEDTAAWAVAAARSVVSGCATESEMVEAIEEFVSSCAVYDLNTARMPPDCADFAKWFLEDSNSGYCVHFATAATVLLRASDIPARYVEGYMFDCRTEEDTVVSGKDAHAWAEYFDSDSGAWKILEATPSAAEVIPVITETPEETIAPTFPELETEPDEPIQETQMPESSKPESNQQQPHEPFRLPGWLKVLMKVLLIAGALVIQADIRIRIKRRRWNQGKPNARAVNRWKQLQSVSRWTKTPIPADLHNLTEKALYSQHILTREELAQYDLFRTQVSKQVAAMHPVRKWILRLILGIA